MYWLIVHFDKKIYRPVVGVTPHHIMSKPKVVVAHQESGVISQDHQADDNLVRCINAKLLS